jgi:hypothetical protein
MNRENRLRHHPFNLFLLLFLSSFSTLSFAADSHFYLSGAVGSSSLSIGNGNPQVNYYNGFLNDAYPPQKSNNSSFLFSLKGGYELIDSVGLRPAVSLGLGLYTMPSEYGYSGQLIETALGDPSSVLYNYKYNITSTRLMADA